MPPVCPRDRRWSSPGCPPLLRLLLAAARLAVAVKPAEEDEEVCGRAIALASAVPRNGKYLDVGAGSCPCRKAVKLARPDIRYIAQDFAGFTRETVTEAAAKNILNKGYCPPGLDIVSDITSIPLPDGEVDAVHCESVLEHVPDVVEALREMARILGPGGRMYVSLPFGGGLHNLPFHYYAGLTHRFFEHHAERYGLLVKNWTYSFTPWSTEAPRLWRIQERFAECFEYLYPSGRQAVQVTAQIADNVLRECSCAKDPKCYQIHSPMSIEDLEFEFPDAISVQMVKPALVVRNRQPGAAAGHHTQKAREALQRRDQHDRIHAHHREALAELALRQTLRKPGTVEFVACRNAAVYRVKPGISWLVPAAREGFDIAAELQAQHQAPESASQRALRPVATREDLGSELRRLGLRGIGVEVGAQKGVFSHLLLEGWRSALLYVQVDTWPPSDSDFDEKVTNQQYACGAAVHAVRYGMAGAAAQCRASSLDCVGAFEDLSLDFVHIEPREAPADLGRGRLLADLQAYWPKLRAGGVMAGGGYAEDAARGAVDDFFGGEAAETPEDLRRRPRQVATTYREPGSPTWMVMK